MLEGDYGLIGTYTGKHVGLNDALSLLFVYRYS